MCAYVWSLLCVFIFKQKTAYEVRISDWSSDVCSSDLVADGIIEMIAGAMRTLRIGDPALLDTDIGPVIDAGARATLEAHIAWLENNARRLCVVKLGEETGNGHFVGPVAYEIDSKIGRAHV